MIEEIRKATPGDVPGISELILRTVREVIAADYTPEVIDKICLHFTEEIIAEKMARRDVFVAIGSDGALMGTISLEETVLHSLFVEPSMRGKGIGAELVGYIERHALSKGHSELQLSSSLTALEFYKRHGYREIRDELLGDFATIRMRKSIDNDLSR